MVRERLSWGVVHPAEKQWNWQGAVEFDALRAAYVKNDVKLLEMAHEQGYKAVVAPRGVAALLFLGVGVEMGVGGWTTVYAGATTPLRTGSIAMLVSGYWVALTAGRLLGAVLGVRITSRALAALAVGALCLGSATLVLGSGSVGWTVAGTLVVGVGMGPIFPTTVVLGTELFRAAPSRAVSVIIAVSSLGGMLLPPLQGLLLERVSPLASVAQVAVACAGMLVLLLLVRRGSAREAGTLQAS